MASTEQPEPPTQSGLPPGDDGAARPREALVATAVKFLQNPKVRESALATRKAFLRKKVSLLTDSSQSADVFPKPDHRRMMSCS
ncbi:peroxisomal membrane protein pex14 [Ataeniobius toweri]|uniref:Peroxisomal membrane protein PEX14 n=1 Tax=Ataeniobius toweri TaxID=208326 RepID=A0ABU7CBE9_9TELE|nr:peroxisomal membrane protein pex14 [Ataeniobius toweri]